MLNDTGGSFHEILDELVGLFDERQNVGLEPDQSLFRRFDLRGSHLVRLSRAGHEAHLRHDVYWSFLHDDAAAVFGIEQRLVGVERRDVSRIIIWDNRRPRPGEHDGPVADLPERNLAEDREQLLRRRKLTQVERVHEAGLMIPGAPSRVAADYINLPPADEFRFRVRIGILVEE